MLYTKLTENEIKKLKSITKLDNLEILIDIIIFKIIN